MSAKEFADKLARLDRCSCIHDYELHASEAENERLRVEANEKLDEFETSDAYCSEAQAWIARELRPILENRARVEPEREGAE